MSFIKNAKIRIKLIFSFATLLLSTLIVSIYASVAITNSDGRYLYILQYAEERLELLQEIDLEVMNIRRILGWGLLESSDTLDPSLSVHPRVTEMQNAIDHTIYLLNRFRTNLNNDERIDATTEREINEQLNLLETSISTYVNVGVLPAFEIAFAGDLEAARTLTGQNFGFLADTFSAVTSLFSILNEYIDRSLEEIVAINMTTIRVLLIVTTIALIIGIFLSIVVTNVITKPINRVVDVLDNVSKGNLNVNIRADSNDETGALASSTKSVVDTLTSLTTQIEVMTNDHNKGETDTYIDASIFEGDYANIAESINNLMYSSINTQNQVVGAFIEIAGGNFDASIEQLPGKKAMLNVAIKDMGSQLSAVHAELQSIIKSAVNGEFNTFIQSEKYQGDWKAIMDSLNSLLTHISKPLGEIKDVISNLGHGKFDKKIIGEYSGDFEDISINVNSTIDSLGSYIAEMSDILSSVASGDLTRTVNRDYIGDFKDIKSSINNIVTSLNRTMADIGAASSQVLSGAKQISESALDLAHGASDQSASVIMLNESIALINQQTQENAKNADEASILSEKSTNNATRGNESMNHMMDAMLKIKDSSDNISRVVKVIEDIAFQTNLLALNASVEAARAGEHGRGFAVVAEEVRNLAGRSQTAVVETTGLIQDSISRVDTGSTIATQTSSTLETIVTSANEVLELISSISSSSKEQADAISKISEGVNQISAVIQNNTAVSEETAAASQELNSQAIMLEELVKYFKV